MAQEDKERYASIVLFVYKRLDHARIVIDALLRNQEAKDSMLFIYSDAPKNEQDAAAVRSVRDYIRSVSGFKNVVITE